MAILVLFALHHPTPTSKDLPAFTGSYLCDRVATQQTEGGVKTIKRSQNEAKIHGRFVFSRKGEYFHSMSERKSYSIAKRKPPQSHQEVLARRLRNAIASLEIDGLPLTDEEIAVFEECIRDECSPLQVANRLRERFPGYDKALRA